MEEAKTTYKDFLQPRDAWDALSMKEKAEMIGVAVRNGITNLNDIREKYNEFAEGGNIYDGESQPSNQMVTTGGTGHIPDNYGQGSIDAIRRRLYRNITPFGYHNPISRTLGAIVLNQQDDTRTAENKKIKDSDPDASALDALWATYLNIPENQRRNINSKYGISKTKDGYYRFNNPGIIFNFEQDLSPHGLFGLPGRKAVMMSGILGNYTTGLGRDTRGDYIFYSDSRLNPDGTPNIKTGWDINPYSNTVDADTEETTEKHGQYGQDKKDLSYKIGKALFENVEDISMGIGTPVPIYDKVYLDDIYDVQGKERGGHYLPEITVQGSKHSLGGPLVEAVMNEYKKGGSIHISPSKKGTFTAAAKKHGKSVQAFASQVLAHPENYSPAMRKKANFARNSKRWKHGLGGNLFSGEENHNQQMQLGPKYWADQTVYHDWQNSTIDGGTLPEVIVSPTNDASWLFSTGKYVHNPRKPLADDHAKKVVSNYLSKYDNENAEKYNARISRLADVLDIRGVQFIKNNASGRLKGRAHYIDNSETAYIDDMNDIFAEVAHPWQYAKGNNTIEEEVNTEKYDVDNDPRGGTRYAYPDTAEGETHGFFEPALTEWVESGKISRSLPILNKGLSKQKIIPKNRMEVVDSAASWNRQAVDKRVISMPSQLPLWERIKYNFTDFPLLKKHGLGGNLFLTGGPTQDNDPATKDWEHRREHDEVHPMYQRTQKDEEYWREKQARNAKAAEELNRKKGVVMSALEEQADSTPFTGEGYRQAAEDQRQRVLDKAKEFEKMGRATVTAAELGISGASLLGAWANYRNWANSANMTRKTIANLLQKAQQPLQEAGTLIDGYQTMDGLGNNAFDTYYNGASGILGAAGTIGASDVFRGRYPWIDRILDTSGIIQNAGDFVKFGYDAMSGKAE